MPINLCDECQREEFGLHMSEIQQEVFKKNRNVYMYLCPFIIFICLFSAVYNMILICLSKENRRGNKRTVLLLSLRLAATDSIVAFLNGFATALESFIPAVFTDKLMWLRMSREQSKMLTLIRVTAIAASAYHLLVLGLEHYRAVSAPLQARSQILCSNRLTRTVNIISLFCWAFPFTILFTWFFILGPCKGWEDIWTQDFFFTFNYRATILVLFVLPLAIMIILYVRIFYLVRRHQRGDSIKAITGSGVTEASTVVAVSVPELLARNAASKCPRCSAKDETEEEDNELFITILSEETTDVSEDDTCDSSGIDRQDLKSVDTRSPNAPESGSNKSLDDNNDHHKQKTCIITLDECTLVEEEDSSDGEACIQQDDNANLYSDCDKDYGSASAEQLSLRLHKDGGSTGNSPTSKVEKVDSCEPTRSLEPTALSTQVTRIKDTNSTPVNSVNSASSHESTNGLELKYMPARSLSKIDPDCGRSEQKGFRDSNPISSKQQPTGLIQRTNHMSLDRRSAKMHRQRSNPMVSNGIPTSLECTCDNRFNTKTNKITTSRLLRSNTIGVGSKSLHAKRGLANTPRSTMITRFKGNQRSSISSAIARQFSLRKSYLHRTLTIGSDSQGSVRFRTPHKSSNNDLQSINELNVNKTMSKNIANRAHLTKAVWTPFYILLTYVICYMPVIITNFLTCIDSDYCPFPYQCLTITQRIILGSLTHLGLIFKSVIDPFIYYKRISEVKSAINKFILKKRNRSSYAGTNSMHASQRNHTKSGYHDNNKTSSNSSFSGNFHRHRSLNATNSRILNSTNSCKRMTSRAKLNIIPGHQTGNGSTSASPSVTHLEQTP